MDEIKQETPNTPNTVNVDNIFFDLEDEEVPEVEYLEILSMEEIVKNNPSFIAFTKEEIYDELYNIFKNKNKTNGFIELFYDIVENNKKLIDTTNYIIKADVIKKDYENENISNFISTIKKLSRTQYELSQNAKNRLFFALSYDEKSDKLRFKADTKTKVQLHDDNEASFYNVFKNDDTNLPINSIYYLVPQSTINDYINVQVISHLYNTENINEKESQFYTSLYKLLKAVRPSIDDTINDIENNDLLDYNNINAILYKYNISLDFIKKKDFDKLNEHLTNLLKDEKVEKPIHNTVKIKDKIVNNNKFTFFTILKNIKNLLELSEKVKTNYDMLYIKLQDDKMAINTPPLLYNNIQDIIDALNNSSITLEEVVENIKLVKKSIILEHSINTIKNIVDIDIDKYIVLIDYFILRFELVKNSMYEVSNLHFVDFYKDLKEVKLGNDNSKYEGVPLSLKTLHFEELNEDDVPLFNIDEEIIKENLLEKYWLSTKYKNAVGFIEVLKIILPYINKIQILSRLQINLDLLCDELFNKFKGIPDKVNLLHKNLKDASKLSSTYINDIAKLTPKSVFLLNTDVDTDINKALLDTNKEYVVILQDFLYFSLSWWSLQLQNEVIDETIIFNQNDCYVPCIDKWSLYGYPLDKKSSNGIVHYISCICYEVFNDDDNFIVIPDKLYSKISNIIENDFTEFINNIRENFKKKETVKKSQEKGKETQKKLVNSINNKLFDKLVNEYVDALLFMPGVKYKQVHKYLLGCCLQKIDKNFKPDSDLINVRNDLIAVKKKYSKIRESTKPRILTYLPEKIIDEDDNVDIDDDNISDLDSDLDSVSDLESVSEKSFNKNKKKKKGDKFIKKDKFKFKVKYIKTDMINITVEEWLNSMIDKNPLLPNEIINELLDNTKIALTYIEDYLKYLTNTAKYKKSELISLFIPEKINYKNILYTISTILYKTHSTDKTLLNVSIETITDIIKHTDKLDAIITDYNKQDVDRIKAYIVARAMCLPSNPENNVGGILRASIKVPTNFIEDISKNIHNTVLHKLMINKIPTLEENVIFINSIREQNKNVTLSIMNKKNMEERNIINELKKLGIPNKIEEDNFDIEQEDVDEIKVNEEIVIDDDDGEDDFVFNGEEYDYGDRLDDGANYGFIYS